MLDHVVTRFSKQDLYMDYCQLFLEQEEEGIIERIQVDAGDLSHYT